MAVLRLRAHQAERIIHRLARDSSLRLIGSRDAGAVTVIAERNRLIIRTVEWEDWR